MTITSVRTQGSLSVAYRLPVPVPVPYRMLNLAHMLISLILVLVRDLIIGGRLVVVLVNSHISVSSNRCQRVHLIPSHRYLSFLTRLAI